MLSVENTSRTTPKSSTFFSQNHSLMEKTYLPFDAFLNKMGKLITIISILLFWLTLYANAQTPFDARPLINNATKKDTIQSDNSTTKPKKHFGRAAFEFALSELTPWTYDKFIAKQEYVDISLSTVKHNLNPGSWEFDNDEFETNQFGHPYGGSLFFNSFRSNGYSFWQAAPAAAAGSYLWETFAENQAPAPNDFINTTFGGIVLGEMTYRLSNRLISKKRTGFKRQASEVAAFIIDPMNGLSRIMDGKWGKISDNDDDDKLDSTNVSAEFDLGFRTFSTNNINTTNTSKSGLYGSVKLIYGSAEKDLKTPFSNIYINTEFGQDDSSKVNILSVYGSLIGWDFSKADSQDQELLILSANYDYINNQAFFYGAESAKANLFSQYVVSKGVKINTSFGLGPVLLAAVPDKYLFKGRNYDYTSGVSVIAGGGISIDDKLFYSIDYRGGELFTISGNASHYFLHVVSSELRYALGDGFSLAAEPGYLVLKADYKEHEDVTKNYSYFRISTRYSLKF